MIKERRLKVYGVLFLTVLILVLGRSPILFGIGRIAHLVGLPFWNSANIVESNVVSAANYTQSRSSLIAENVHLKEQIELSSLREATHEALLSENIHLKEMLGRRVNDKSILSRILSRPPLEVYDTFIIDVGARDGIYEGALVYGKGAFVVGTVTRVFDATSVVTLASAPGQTRTVMVAASGSGELTASSTSGTVDENHELVFIGQGGGGFKAQVPKHLSFKNGTPMALPLITPAFVGVISAEYVPSDGSLKEIFGTLPFGINSLEWVTVAVSSSTKPAL